MFSFILWVGAIYWVLSVAYLLFGPMDPRRDQWHSNAVPVLEAVLLPPVLISMFIASLLWSMAELPFRWAREKFTGEKDDSSSN